MNASSTFVTLCVSACVFVVWPWGHVANNVCISIGHCMSCDRDFRGRREASRSYKRKVVAATLAILFWLVWTELQDREDFGWQEKHLDKIPPQATKLIFEYTIVDLLFKVQAHCID